MVKAMKVSKKASAKTAPRKKGWTAKGKIVKAGKLDVKQHGLLQQGRVDRKLVKQATTMTREQWVKAQIGMQAKWPLPKYMNGVKGHTAFKPETFSIATCWTADTKIAYRPHAKAPGSKSHLRYERYSKAKTVGEALKLSSYPADWCWDYERGFLKVIGGRILDEPLDISKMEQSELTNVDLCINAWYVRELARQLGLKPKELSEATGFGESATMRGQRLLAQRQAAQSLEACDREGRVVSEDEVLAVLVRWPFFRNPWRANVFPDGKEWVFSDTLGLLRDRTGDIHCTATTRRYPQVAELFGRYLTDRLPAECKSFTFTSMNVNCNYAAKLHRDQGNFGPSFIKAFGDFTGGCLNYFPEDAGGKLESLPKSKAVKLDLKQNMVLFNGNCAHSVDDFEGSRYSIVYFTVGCHADAPKEHKDRLLKISMPYPAPNEDKRKLLRAPKGYAGGACEAAKGEKKPAFRSFQVANLGRKRPALGAAGVTAAAKRRLEPENQRTFYAHKPSQKSTKK